MVKNKPLF